MDHTEDFYKFLKAGSDTSTGDDEQRTVQGEENTYEGAGPSPEIQMPADAISPGVVAVAKDARIGLLNRSLSELERSATADKALIGQNFSTTEFGSHSPLLQKASSPRFVSIKDQALKLCGRK